MDSRHDLHQSLATSSSSARLHASQHFSSNIFTILLIGTSSAHFSISAVNDGAGTKRLQIGHGNPTGLCLGLHVEIIYEAKQLWQNVCKHGRFLGVSKVSKQIGHAIVISLIWLKSFSVDAAILFKLKVEGMAAFDLSTLSYTRCIRFTVNRPHLVYIPVDIVWCILNRTVRQVMVT